MSDLVVPPAGQPAPSSWLCLHGCSSQSASYQRQQGVPPARAERGFQSGSLPGRRGCGVKFFSYSPSLAASEYPLLRAGDPATLQVFPRLFSCPLLLLCSDRQWQPYKKEETRKGFPVKEHRRTGHPSHSSLPHTASAFPTTLPQFFNPTAQTPSVLTDGFFRGM